MGPRNTIAGWRLAIKRQWRQRQATPELRQLDKTKTGKANLEAFWNGEPGWFFVTWEFFARQPVHYWNTVDVDVIILDEVQRMSNRKSKTWTNVRGMGKNAKKIALSGTFNGNRMQGAWTTLRWLFPERSDSSLYTTPLSFWRWADDWLIIEADEWLGFTEVQGERFEPGTMLSYYQSYIRESDVLDVEEPNVIIVDVPMCAAQKRLYKQLETDLVMWLSTPDPLTGKKPVVLEMPGNFKLRARQITLGVPVLSANGTVTYDSDMVSPKFDMCLDILKSLDPMEPVLVFTHSRQYALAFAEKMNRKGIPAWAWAGNTTEAQRQAALADWGNGLQIIIAVVEAIAEGTDGLQYLCHNEIWVSESNNPLMNKQARARLPRMGQTRVVNRWMLFSPDTHDVGIHSKQAQQIFENNASLKGK